MSVIDFKAKQASLLAQPDDPSGEASSAVVKKSSLWQGVIAGTLLGAAMIGCFYTADRFDVSINATESLAGAVYAFDSYNLDPSRGEYIRFHPHANPYFPSGSVFGKRVVGMPGDRIEVRGRQIWINGKFIHAAKEKSRLGDPLQVLNIPDGVIPANHFYVLGDHKDSFDSRYQLIGLIARSEVLGTGKLVF